MALDRTHWPARLVLIAALLQTVAFPLHAEQVIGAASLGDHAELEIGGKRVRLYGVAVVDPEAACTPHSGAWRCGEAAFAALAGRLRGERLRCDIRGDVDATRAPPEYIAVCSLSDGQGEELNAWLISRGWGLASSAETGPYADVEARARAAGAGLWRDGFVPAGAWRAAARDTVLAVLGSGGECDLCALRRSRMKRTAGETD